MNRQYRAGIIGLGFVGAGDPVSGERIGQNVAHLDGNHAEALAKNERIALAAGCDLDVGRRERFAQRTGATTYTDWREMLRRERPDVVSIATSPPSHAELVAACAESGVRAVYCEKPLTTRLSDAERMIAACERSGTLLVVNHNRRWNPNYRRLREAVAAGELGELTSVNLQWGAGRLGCTGTHLFDAVRMLTGRNVQAVSGTLDTAARPDCRGADFRDPGGWGLLRLDGGLIATVDAPDDARVPGRLVLNGTAGRAVTGGDDVTLEFWDGRRDHWPGRRNEATSMDRTVAEIVAWLDGTGPVPCPATDSLRALEVVIAFHASHRRHAAWTALPLTGEDREIEVVCG